MGQGGVKMVVRAARGVTVDMVDVAGCLSASFSLLLSLSLLMDMVQAFYELAGDASLCCAVLRSLSFIQRW